MRAGGNGQHGQEMDMSTLYALKPSSLWSVMRSQHASLWFLALYFFFEYVRPQTLYPVIDILPWAQVSMMAAMVSAFMDRSAVLVSHVENRLFLLLALVIVLSGLFAFRPAASLALWSVMGGWLIIYFLLISVVNSRQRLLLFILIYCLFNLKMAQHGALSWAERGFSFASFGLIGSPGWFRNSGEYAIQMLIYSPIALALVVSLRQYWGPYKKIFLYACAISGYMAVIGASSRGAQIALAVTAIWFLLKQKNGVKGIVVIVLAAVALFYLLPDEQMQRFREMGDDKNSLQRLVYWRYALENVIPHYPVLGLGYNNWLAYLWYREPGGMGPLQMVEQVHNIYLQAAAELGLLGLLIFLLMVVYAFVTNARTRALTRDMDDRLMFNLSYALDAGLIGYLVAGSFVTVLYYPFFWIQVAMIVMLHNVARQSVDGQAQVPRRGAGRNRTTAGMAGRMTGSSA